MAITILPEITPTLNNGGIMQSRREFNKTIGTASLVLATGMTISLDGCNVMGDIVSWGPVGQASFDSMMTLLESVGLLTPSILLIVPVVDRGFTDLIADAKVYESLNPPPAGILAKI